MDGFEGNEARLGAQMSVNAPGAVRAGADGLQLLSERDYIYSDYYRPRYAIRQPVAFGMYSAWLCVIPLPFLCRGTGKDTHEELDLDASHDGANLKAYADDQVRASVRILAGADQRAS